MAYSLNEIATGIYLIDSGSIVTVAVEDKVKNEITLFDSALDLDSGKKIDNLFKKTVNVIYHTHSHADHIGADQYFVNKYSSKIFIHSSELSFATMPELESALLYGGSSPTEGRNKFLCAKEISSAKPLELSPFTINNSHVTPILTAGHSPAHTSFLIDDNLFVGDALFIPEVIEKHKILYLYNPMQYKTTLDILANIDVKSYIMCHHGVVSKEIFLDYIEKNKQHIAFVENMILSQNDGLSAEEITACVTKLLKIEGSTVLWLLMLSTIKGYLMMMQQKGLMKTVFQDGIKWTKSL